MYRCTYTVYIHTHIERKTLSKAEEDESWVVFNISEEWCKECTEE